MIGAAVTAVTTIAATFAALIEIGSTYFLFNFSNTTYDLLAFFGFHSLASVLLAWVVYRVLPVQYRRPAKGVLALLFSFSFFIPIFGAFGMLTAIFVNAISPKPATDVPFSQVNAPEYVLSIREPDLQFRVSGMRAMLLDQTVPSGVRIKSLIALQSKPTRIAGPTLRKLLGDSADDIRLLAYGMLDNKEKAINAQIGKAHQELKLAGNRADNREQRLQSLRQLAELHWEMSYTGLAQGDLRDHTLAQAAGFLNQALRLSDHDSGLWFLHGRTLHAQRRLAEAAEAYNVAVSCGLEESRVLSYIAEVAFERREFDAVREYIGLVAETQVTSTMAPIIRYWCPGAPA